jgi:UDP-N-acetylglucosamine diphosphorylase/glucosamine-1-phosphate N-acetyltransferase
MLNLIFFDDENRDYLLPLSYTRPVAEIRVGLLTIREKWCKILNGRASYLTQEHLANKYPFRIDEDNIIIHGGLLPNDKLARMIQQLDTNEALTFNGELIAARMDEEQLNNLTEANSKDEIRGFELDDVPFTTISRLWHIYQYAATEIPMDIARITYDRKSADLPEGNQLFGDNIFLEKTAKVRGAILNAETGPIYLGPKTEVMEGAIIRGPFGLLEGSTVKMGAKIYGPTGIGKYCKVGGEINNVIFQGFSNKGHDGFLGNSVIGEWCNIGADSNNSNLKNNYEEVKLWQYPSQRFEKTGTQFCGLFMGDHAKCGINTMFNTGTVVGVSANVFGAGYPRNFIPSFAWGGASGYQSFRIDKALETANAMMQRRGKALDEQDKSILEHIYSISAGYRNWEK